MGVRRNILLAGMLLAAIGLGAQTPGFAQGVPTQDASGAELHKAGSWTVRCAKGSGCQMIEVFADPNSHAAVAGIVISYVPKSDGYYIHFIVPLGVAFNQGLNLTLGSLPAPHLKFRRCERDGCYVEGNLPQSMLTAMQAEGAKGEMDVTFINGRKLQLQIALDGFADGLALLKKSGAGDAPAKH